jgi:hypothetical protein
LEVPKEKARVVVDVVVEDGDLLERHLLRAFALLGAPRYFQVWQVVLLPVLVSFSTL